MPESLRITFPSRGKLAMDGMSQMVFTSAPSYVMQEQSVRQCLPPTDGLVILHGIRARRMADQKSFCQSDIAGKAQRKRTMDNKSDVPADKRRRTSCTPNGLDITGGPPQSSADAGDISYGRVVFTADALAIKTLSDLKDVCRSRRLPVGGKKTQLVHRILTSQNKISLMGRACWSVSGI
eukprot:jgi/Ulvmu1/4174/UM019_0153.1